MVIMKRSDLGICVTTTYMPVLVPVSWILACAVQYIYIHLFFYLRIIIKIPYLEGSVTNHSTLKTGAEYSPDTPDSNKRPRAVTTQKFGIKVSYTHFTYCIWYPDQYGRY